MIGAAVALLLSQAIAQPLPEFPKPWVEFSADLSRDTFNRIRAGSYRYCLHRAGRPDIERCMLVQDSNMAGIARSLRTLRAWRRTTEYAGVIDNCWKIYSDNPNPDARVYESCLAGHAEAAQIRGMIRPTTRN